MNIFFKLLYFTPKMVRRALHRYNNWITVQALRSQGATIGMNTTIKSRDLSISNPKMLSIGNNVIIDINAELIQGQSGRLIIGDNCYIGKRTIISAQQSVTLGKDVLIAHNATIIDEDHNYTDQQTPIIQQGGTTSPIIVEDNVWIAANSTVLKGSHIEKRCVVAANSVVRGKIDSNQIIGGIPAISLKKI